MWTSEAVLVAVPAREAYREWVRFESFPRFVDGLVASGQYGVASGR